MEKSEEKNVGLFCLSLPKNGEKSFPVEVREEKENVLCSFKLKAWQFLCDFSLSEDREEKLQVNIRMEREIQTEKWWSWERKRSYYSPLVHVSLKDQKGIDRRENAMKNWEPALGEEKELNIVMSEEVVYFDRFSQWTINSESESNSFGWRAHRIKK